MKTHLVVAMAAVVLAGLFMTSGCVSRGEYDNALAQNRRMKEQMDQVMASAQELRQKNQALTDELNQLKAELEAANKKAAMLDEANRQLADQLANLQKKYAELSAAGTPAPIGPLPAGLNEALKRLAEQYPDLLEYDARNGMIKLKSDLTFDKGSDNVSSSAQEALKQLASILNGTEAGGFNIYIVGHTDDLPIVRGQTKVRHPNNWYLSVHRAVAVEEVLAKAGMAQPRLAAMGFGEFHPVAPNAPGKKGNAVNRRVEIWVVSPDLFLTGGQAAPPAEKAAEKPAQEPPM